jgi:hypothetical protein
MDFRTGLVLGAFPLGVTAGTRYPEKQMNSLGI